MVKSSSNTIYRKAITTCALVVLVSFCLSSCTDFIDPSAANSLSAIIAVIGEYFYASLTLILVVFLWILRPAGFALVVLGFMGLCSMVDLSVRPIILICIGTLLFLTSFAPIKQYEPLVVISKHFKFPKKEKEGIKRNKYQDFFLQLLIGFITLVVEYSIFAK